MSYVLPYVIALGTALLTTLCVLALWVAYARVVDKDRAQTVFLPLVFLFVPLIFIVSAISNVAAVLLGQIAVVVAPSLRTWVTVAAAGGFVWCGCAWTQRGLGELQAGQAPVSAVPVALFGLVDMLILAGGLRLLPNPPTP